MSGPSRFFGEITPDDVAAYFSLGAPVKPERVRVSRVDLRAHVTSTATERRELPHYQRVLQGPEGAAYVQAVQAAAAPLSALSALSAPMDSRSQWDTQSVVRSASASSSSSLSRASAE